MARKRKTQRVSTPGDYGIDPSRTGGTWEQPVRTTVGGARPQGRSAGGSGLTLSGANLVNTSTLLGADGKPITPPGAIVKDPSKPLAAQNYLTAAEQEQAKTAPSYAQQQAAEKPQESWLSRIFNTEDTWEQNEDGSASLNTGDLGFFGAEGIWDSALRGLQWGTDRLNQVTVAGLSGLPGGTETLTWDEAGEVSFGQQIVANAGVTEGRRRRGEAGVGDFIAIGLGGFASIGAGVAGAIDPNTGVQREGFDIRDEKDREVFSEGWEKTFSGVGDFGFVFADPTLLMGWAAKAGRVRYVDRLINSPERMQEAVTGVVDGKRVLDANLDAMHGTDAVAKGAVTVADGVGDASRLKISPAAMFLHNATRVDETGRRVMSYQEIYNHKVIRYATNRDALAVALHNTDNYDDASLVYRYAVGDSTAATEMLERRPDLLSGIIDGEREVVQMTLRSDPKAQAKTIAEYEAKMDKYDAELEWLKKNAADDSALTEKLEFVRTKKNKVARDWMNVSNGTIDDAPTPLALELAQKRVERLVARDTNLRRALDEAGQPVPSGLYNSMQGSKKAFSSNTAFGRRVERSRQANAKAQYETEATRGSHFWQSTDFAHLDGPLGSTRRLMRVWRYSGAETPSGVIHLAGIGAQESVREMRAMLNSVRIYGGKAREVSVTAADGTVTTRMVGGSLAKDELLTQYANAIARGGVEGQREAEQALRKIEGQMKTDLSDWYEFDGDTMEMIFNNINEARQSLKDQILSRGFWMEGKTEHKAPYLETHLQGSEIAPNWRAVETRIKQVQKERHHAYRKGIDTGRKWAGDSYDLFQDLWRPATLLRLGYTQRNVAEGLFRSTATQFSLMPLWDAARQGGMSVGNVTRTAKYGREGARGAVEKATVAAREGRAMPKKYQKWHAAQKAAVDAQIQRNRQVVDFAYEQLAGSNATWRTQEVARLNARSRNLLDEKNRMRDYINDPEGAKVEGLTVDQAQAVLDRNTVLIDESYDKLRRLSKIKGGDEGPLSTDLEVVSDNLEYLYDSVQPMLVTQARMLEDPKTAVGMFRQQTLAKRRLWQGEGTVTDPETLKGVFESYRRGEAFDPNDSYANIALMNLSADHTTRQAMSLQMATVERLLTHQVTRSYVEVQPGKEGYFDGLATVFNQWKSSDIGQIIIKDVSEGHLFDEEIANRVASFLRADPRGREVAHVLTEMNKTPGGGQFREYGERVARATAKAEKEATPLRDAADEARLAVQRAEDEVADARRAAKAWQAANPRSTTLRDAEGKQISDPDKYVAKATDARDRAKTRLVEAERAVRDAPKRAAAAKQAMADARAEVRDAKRRLKEDQKADPRRKQLYDSQGRKIMDPDAYIARAVSAHADEVQEGKAWAAVLKERHKIDEDAKAGVLAARQTVQEAKARLKQVNKDNPRPAALTVGGKRIDPDKHVQKAREAYEKAEDAYETRVSFLSQDPGIPGGAFAPVMSMEDALVYANEMVRRYRALTAGSKEVQDYVFGTRVLANAEGAPLTETSKALERLLTAKTADGGSYQMIPVIGNVGEQIGSKQFMDSIRTASNLAFRALGTIPEDTMVRAPFYGRTWTRSFDEGFAELSRQNPEGLTFKQINILRDAAHRRALKDTKDWLYTIDRRTVLGSYGEYVFPFISASQNSVTTVGRIVWNDPRVLAIMGMIWQAPERAGIADDNGDMHFSFPIEWLPEDMRKTLGLSGMMDVKFNLNQFNLITPNPGGNLPIPAPGPVVAVPFSEMMKHDFLVSPLPPPILDGILGKEMSAQVWDATKAYMFGTDTTQDFTGMSSTVLSLDKALPAWGQKLFQLWQGEGSSSAYTSWYDKIYQSEYLRWAAGERDVPPTPEEVSDMTRNFYFLRMGMNLTAFTPPGFTSQITPIVESVQKIYETTPDSAQAQQKIYELYGPTIQQLMKITSTASVAGLSASEESVRIAQDHSQMIGAVAPSLNDRDSLDVLGLLSPTRGEYDPSFSAWQQLNKIPNTDRMYREIRNPAQAAIEAQKSAGWATYLKNMDVINSILAQRGLKSLQAKGAVDLLATKKQMVEVLKNDPRYTAWYGDYQNFSSSRTTDSVMLIQTALNDQGWRDKHEGDPTWGEGGAADQYMYARSQTLEALNTTQDPDLRRQIKEEWVNFRFDLGTRYSDWGAKAEKYLAGDDDPESPQVILQSAAEPYTPSSDQNPFGEQMPTDQMPLDQPFGSQP